MRNYIFALDVSEKPIQYYDSKVCGAYVAYLTSMIYKLCNTRTIEHIFKNFKNNKIVNDSRVIRFLEYNYPAKSCHNKPVYGNMKATLKQLSGNSNSFCPKLTLGLQKCFKNMKCECFSSTGRMKCCA